MKKYTFFSGLLAIMVSGLLASCAADSELLSVPETASTTFNVGLDKLTRAGQPFDKQVYDAKMYLYEGRNEADGTISYAFKKAIHTRRLTTGSEGIEHQKPIQGSVYGAYKRRNSRTAKLRRA